MLTFKELAARLDSAIHGARVAKNAATRLRANGDLDGAYDAARDAVGHLETVASTVDALDALRERADAIRASRPTGTPMLTEHGDSAAPNLIRDRNPWEPGSGMELRARAHTAIERATDVSDAGKHKIASALDTGADDGELARWAVATSDPHYRSAWGKVMRDPQGHLEFSQDELGAFQRARQVQRAMSLADAAGGYLVPFQLDPTVLLTSDGAVNAIRRVARTVVATGDIWHGVSSAGALASYDAEADEVSDDSPTFAQPTVTVRMGRVFLPVSIEAFSDMHNFTTEMGRIIADAKDQLEAQVFVDGVATSNEPVGFVTAAVANGQTITGDGDETFDADDVYALQESLGPRWQDRAVWMTTLPALNRIRRMHNPSGNEPPLLEGNQLLGRPVHVASHMDSPAQINPAQTAANYVLAFGDFSQYVIAERAGLVVETISHLFGGNRRPVGMRGLFGWFRHGANTVVPSAIKLLNVATTA